MLRPRPALGSARAGLAERLHHAEIGAGNASGQASARIAMYCAVHSPIPGQRAQCRERRLDVGTRRQVEAAFDDRSRQRNDAARAGGAQTTARC